MRWFGVAKPLPQVPRHSRLFPVEIKMSFCVSSPARVIDFDLDGVIFLGGGFCLQSLAHMMETVRWPLLGLDLRH